MKHHTITGGGGVRLNVVETGNPAGRAVLFIHGWSQSHASWSRQLGSELLRERFRLVALDLRGHGDSDKPDDAYGDSVLWADDVARTIGALDLRAPVLVGWSYGGFVINDYLRVHGDAAISGINYVAAATDMGIDVGYRQRTDGWEGVLRPPNAKEPHAFSPLAEDAAAAMRIFVRNCFATPLPHVDELMMLGINLRVPPRVRQALFSRTISNDDVLAAVRVPVLVTHGEQDRIVDCSTAQHIADTVPGAQLSLYPGIGHAPFWEDSGRFERELAALVGTTAP
jgi:non-heme chloroperoxidase